MLYTVTYSPRSTESQKPEEKERRYDSTYCVPGKVLNVLQPYPPLEGGISLLQWRNEWQNGHHNPGLTPKPVLLTLCDALRPPHAKRWLIGKDSDAGRGWGQGEEGMTEDEMAGWNHQLNGCESEWTPGAGDGQGGPAYCDLWGHKELDMTEWLNWTELKMKKLSLLS